MSFFFVIFGHYSPKITAEEALRCAGKSIRRQPGWGKGQEAMHAGEREETITLAPPKPQV